MRWIDYDKQTRRRRRRPYPYPPPKVKEQDNSTQESNEYEIIEDVDKYHENTNKFQDEFDQYEFEDIDYNDKKYKDNSTVNNSKDADLVSTIEKLFNGDNEMVKEIIDTLQETGILDNFREPLNVISRVYGPMLDGNTNNQDRTPMWAYNRANRRIKHMQKENANKQLHSEMYSLILKQVKDMLVKNYGSRIKDNMPVLFDEDDE